MTVHAHWRVAKTARALAAVLYETCASRSNDWYRRHPDSRAWIEANYPKLLEQARATLVQTLSTLVDEKLRDEVADALIKDNTLRAGRVRHNMLKQARARGLLV